MLFDDQKSCGRKAVRLGRDREGLRSSSAAPPIGVTASEVSPGREGLATPVVPLHEPAGMFAIMAGGRKSSRLAEKGMQPLKHENLQTNPNCQMCKLVSDNGL
jgi:hypothetical protein